MTAQELLRSFARETAYCSAWMGWSNEHVHALAQCYDTVVIASVLIRLGFNTDQGVTHEYSAYLCRQQSLIPLPLDQELTEAARVMLKSGAALNVSRMFAGTEDLFKPTADLINAVFHATSIDVKLRELIILRCAKKLNSAYEWQANAVMAQNAGCSPEEIDVMASDGPVTGVDEDVAEMCAACDELCLAATLTDDTLDKLIKRYGNTVARKYVLVISWFNLLSRFLNGCRVQKETGDNIGSRTSPV